MQRLLSRIPSTRSSTPTLRTGKSYGKIYNWFPQLNFSNRRKKPDGTQPKAPEISEPVDTNENDDTSGSATVLNSQTTDLELAEKFYTEPTDKIEIEVTKDENGNPLLTKDGNPITKIKEKLNAIITLDIKQKKNFQKELAYLTRSDAHHDLGKEITDTMYKKNTNNFKIAYNAGMPKVGEQVVEAEHAFHEGNAFASVVISATDANGNTINIHTGNNHPEDYLKEALVAAPDCTNNTENKYSTFAIGVGGETYFKYRVHKFVTNCKMNKEAKDEDLVTKAYKGTTFGCDFINNTKLCEDGNSAAFVVDYSQHHFLENLATGDNKGEGNCNYNIYYLMTPEVVNDPAEKPNVNNKNLFGITGKNVTLVSCVEEDNGPISYTPFDPNDPLTSNNFFSRYNFTISPVQKIITKAKAEKLIVSLNISYDNGSRQPLTDTIEDSHGENSIKTVLGYIKTILQQLTGIQIENATADKYKFNFNSKVQQKRGGDWFQALTCLTAKNRTYKQILPPNTSVNLKLPSDTCPVYLVTHDRIAVAYALLNGVNVIYVDYYGRIFVFKNGGDPALKSSGKPMEEILYDGIKRKYFTEEGNGNTDFTNLINTANYYNEVVHGSGTNRGTKTSQGAVRGFIQTEKELFAKNVDSVINDLKDVPVNDVNKQRIIEKDFRNNLQNLFMSSVRLAFIYINLIDINEDLKIVDENKTLFGSGKKYGEGEVKSESVSKFSKSLNIIKGIQDRFGLITSETEKDRFNTSIGTWINKNSEMLDVYKAAKNILKTDNQSGDVIFDFNRFKNFFTNESKEKEKQEQTDKNIFLPFIQILPDYDKTLIFNAINAFAEKIGVYYTTVALKTQPRAGKTFTPQRAFYNNVANLLYETMLFIQPKQPPSSGGAVDFTIGIIQLEGVDSDSTDNIVLKEDYDDFYVIKNIGKFSANEIGDDEEVSTSSSSSSGGSLKGGAAYAGRVFKQSCIISDVSVKQITWPLISSSLFDKSDKQSLINFLTKIPEYISELNQDRDITENQELLESTFAKLNGIIGEISEPARGVIRQALASIEREQIQREEIDVEQTKVNKLINDVLRISKFLLEKMKPKVGGGDSSPSLPTESKDLMKDFNFGFHPLVPIYAMLTSYYSIIGHKSQSDPFFYTYFTYVNILEKMKKVLEEKYLDNTLNSPKTASAYMIGLGLYNMIFASHTSILQHNTILKMINMSQSDYAEFSLKNDGFVSSFSGAILQTPEEEIIGSVLLDNPLFNNFINNEVNIKQIMEEGTPVENLPTYEVLQERMFKLMGEIVVKVNADRGTPIVSAPGLASGVSSGIPGISLEERASRAALGQQKYQENVAKGLINPERKTGTYSISELLPSSQSQTGIEVTSSIGTRRKGGKKGSKRYLNNKRKTIKKRVNKKTSKNTTKKRYRRPRRTRRV